MTPQRRQYMKDYYTRYYHENRSRITIYNMWNHCKQRAQQKDIPCTITIDDISIPNECPRLGIPLVQGTKVVCANSPTVDQIEIGKGYTPENIQIVCNLANRMKQNATLEQCIALGDWARRQLEVSSKS